MKTVIISAFDSGFFDYAVRMFNSVRAFHPNIQLYAGDLGLTQPQRTVLISMDVIVIQHPRAALLRKHGLRLCFCDFLLHSFLEGVEYDVAIWIDADTMVLKPIVEKLELYLNEFSIVGHPGRYAGGPIYTMGERFRIAPGTTHRDFIEKYLTWEEDWPYIATGLWATKDKLFLKYLDTLVDLMDGLTDDSPVFAAAACHLNISTYQLDAAVWNFGRHLVSQANFVNGKIVYGDNIEPNTVGFSLTDCGTRLGSAAIEQFYLRVILPRLQEK